MKPGEAMDRNLLDAIEASDVARSSDLLLRNIKEGIDPWEIHLSLFPVVKGVLNPPFINPHLPKMYRVCRELAPYLSQARIAALVSLEVREYARRPKAEKIRRGKALTSPVIFKDIETAIKENDPGKASVLMAAFLEQKGGVEFVRRLLLLGSGYLSNSLGHSVSCTAFLLLEMLERTDQDLWPALSAWRRGNQDGHVSHWHFQAESGGVMLDFAHHGRVGNLPHTRVNPLRTLAMRITNAAAKAGDRIPDLAIRRTCTNGPTRGTTSPCA